MRTGGEEEFSETALLMMLCLTVAVLIYVRTRMVDRMRRQEREQRAGENHQGNANGVFPPPGDVRREDWAVVR